MFHLSPQPFTLCSRLLRILQVLVRFPLPRCRLGAFHLQVVYFLLSFDILYRIFHYLSLNTPVKLDVLAVVVDVVAGVVDVQGHVLVLQVLLQPALVGLAATQLLVHLQRFFITVFSRANNK